MDLTRWEPFVSRWDPFRELENTRARLTGLLGPTPRMLKEGKTDEALTVAEWMPLVDIVEDDKEYLIKAELPEVKKEDVKVTVVDDVLTIAGERMMLKEEKTKKCRRIERAYGTFARSFALPDDADAAKIQAEFKDGLLKIHLAKTARALQKSVEVKIG
jgi:HSP20 family protein